MFARKTRIVVNTRSFRQYNSLYMGCGVWVGGDEGGRFTFETHHHYCYVYTSTDKLNANNFSSPNPTFFLLLT